MLIVSVATVDRDVNSAMSNLVFAGMMFACACEGLIGAVCTVRDYFLLPQLLAAEQKRMADIQVNILDDQMKELLAEMAEIRHIEEGHLEEDNIVMPPRKARCMAGMEHLDGMLDSGDDLLDRPLAGARQVPLAVPPSKADWADWEGL